MKVGSRDGAAAVGQRCIVGVLAVTSAALEEKLKAGTTEASGWESARFPNSWRVNRFGWKKKKISGCSRVECSGRGSRLLIARRWLASIAQ